MGSDKIEFIEPKAVPMNSEIYFEQTLLQPEVMRQKLIHTSPSLLNKISDIGLSDNQEPEPLLLEVIKFLILIAKSNESLTPSYIVDLAWHELILFTRTYDNFCQAYFARFIHHNPNDDKSVNQVQYFRTLALYEEYFGNINHDYWNSSYNSCGSCEGFSPE